MSIGKFSQRLTRRTYKFVTVLVRLLGLLAIVLLATFIVLRIYGVPDPLLRELVKRANNAGIPVDIGQLKLTLRGWLASDVHYYSRHPDDLEPVFQAKEVRFTREYFQEEKALPGWHIDVVAKGIRLNPSVEWGIEIPAESASREIETAKLSLGFLKDRIELSNGTLHWLGAQFGISGAILKSGEHVPDKVSVKQPDRAVRKQNTVLPVYVNAEQFQKLEDRIKTIRMDGGLEVVLDFVVDTRDYASSQISFALNAADVSVKDVQFSIAEIEGRYRYPKLEVDLAHISLNSQSIWLEGDYDFETGELQGELDNKITAKELLALLPTVGVKLLEKVHLDFEEIPRFALKVGPGEPASLLNHLSGQFSVRRVTYFGMLIESLEGKVTRKHDRLDLSELTGSVRGQETRAEEIGSCMMGGSAVGSVFWDAASHEFGVRASGSMDPNLLLNPLSMVRIATNVIDRFKFPDEPPVISLELGADYTDWSTFYIDIQGTGNQVQLHEGLLSSVNTAAFYKHGILKLDPIAATLGADYLKGNASLNFFKSTATFDAEGTLPPAVLEDAICPGFNLFGKAVKTPASTKINARGSLDWATMQATDFIAEVESERLEIPVASVDSFVAVVTGKGPVVSVEQATFAFYGGKGSAEFSIRLDPALKGMPYEVDTSIVNADFNKFLLFLNPNIGDKIAGALSGNIQYKADMAIDFFKSATGKGQMKVENGQLADLPLFSGFSRLIRKIIPGFNIFSITSLRGTFELKEGTIHSDDAYFEGDVISAKGHGNYSKQYGFDAFVQAQILRENAISKVIRVITDPFFKLFELKLEGRLSDPTWKLEKFHGSSDKSSADDAEISD